MLVEFREGAGGVVVPDAVLDEDNPDTNYGSDGTLRIGARSVGIYPKRWNSILRYTVALPDGSTVNWGKLRAHVITPADLTRTTYLHEISTGSTGFVESEVTWNDRKDKTAWDDGGGDYETENQVTFDLPTTAGDHDSGDLKVLIDRAIADRGQVLELLWRMSNMGYPLQYLEVGSGENAIAAWRPRLLVDYNPPPMVQRIRNIIRRSA